MTAVEFIISLKDKVSSQIDKIGAEFSKARSNSDKLINSIDSLRKKSESLRIMRDASTSISEVRRLNSEIQKTEKSLEKLSGEKTPKNLLSGLGSVTGMLSTIGVGVGFYKIGEMMHDGIEKTHALHQAEAQLTNTMQNMGTYSKEAFEKVIKSSGDLSSKIKYSRTDIVSLQSQLRLVGNIGEKEMQRLVMASADMSTKFGVGLNEAGNMIAKAVNNPEMMRRLGMQLKIDPAIVEHIQTLAKHGKEAAARMELISIIEGKIGGAARSAFDADPLAKYNKIIGSMKMALGDAAVNIQVALGPALIWIAGLFKELFKGVSWFIAALKNGNPWIWGMVAAVGTLAVYMGMMAAKAAIVTIATNAWTVAQWLFNTALYGCPIIWIVLAIGALVGAIVWAWNKFEGFRAAIKATWEVIKDFGNIIKDYIIDRIKGIISGLGSMAKAIGLLFKGQFKEAWQEAKKGADDLIGFSAAKKAITNTKRLVVATPEIFREKLANEKAIAKAKLPGQDEAKTDPSKVANKTTTEAVATGGTRNTSIIINLKNLVESIVFEGGISENRTEVEKQVTEALLRVLYAAQSAG